MNKHHDAPKDLRSIAYQARHLQPSRALAERHLLEDLFGSGIETPFAFRMGERGAEAAGVIF